MPGEIVPKHRDHAIAKATIAAEWQEPLNEALFKQILDRHEVIAADFPRKQVGRGIVVNIGGATPSQSAAPTAINSVAFDKVRPDGESEWLMIVNPTFVAITCDGSLYTRWSQISVKALGYLKFVLETVIPARPVTVLGLQYVDEFFWRGGEKEAFTADKLFRRGRHLAPAVYESVGLWHSHIGFWHASEAPVKYKTLNNINVSVIDTPAGERAAQIVMAHRCTLERALPEYSEGLFGAAGVVGTLLSDLHGVDKGVLRDLLQPDVAAKIHLDGA